MNLKVRQPPKISSNDIIKIATLRIHPGIGIARVGNSPEEYFIGPEIPGKRQVPIGGYKDAGDQENHIEPRIKRQAAYFRIFAYDQDENILGEITTEIADITWTIHIANKKAEWDRFRGLEDENLYLQGRRREKKFWRNSYEEDRNILKIDPGPRTLSKLNNKVIFDKGKFKDIEVILGHAIMDEYGRLLVLGGFGKSATTNPNQKLRSFANNDYWYDDVSDGPVSAEVKFKDKSGTNFQAMPSWVIVTPPDFAPAVTNLVTLYDIAKEVAIENGWIKKTDIPSFKDDIFPIFDRTSKLQWVQERVLRAHGANPIMGYDFQEMMTILSTKSNDDRYIKERIKIFEILRNPSVKKIEEANGQYMPYLSGDNGDLTSGVPDTWFTITKTQYEMMKKWKAGQFFDDLRDEADIFEKSIDEITPNDLDRAMLESTAGGPFFPGIEGTWIFRDPKAYREKFRLDDKKFEPGDITKRMACPWQADFYSCKTHWWPAQRPDEVLPSYVLKEILDINGKINALNKESIDSNKVNELELEKEALWTKRTSWTRGLDSNVPSLTEVEGRHAMVNSWHILGFVTDSDKNNIPFELVNSTTEDRKDTKQIPEINRNKYDNLPDEEYFHLLINIEDHADFLPKAKELAINFLSQADFKADANYSPFHYTQEAFDERMQQIYEGYVRTMNDSTWYDSGIINWPVVINRKGDEEVLDSKPFFVGRFSDRVIKERVRQLSPFNLTDGSWLQNILSTGPCDEVQSRLFQVWADEAGNGETELNHPNVYDQLLKSFSIYMPPIKSREFIEQDFLSGAYKAVIFQLGVGLFPQEFLPELLGMTLYLEWEATPTLTPMVRTLHNRFINPQFYRMHVAIDNITAGHGALAKEAIKIYLENKLEEGGEDAVQEHWSRIWTGYVTWATVGGMGMEFFELALILDRKQIDTTSYVLDVDPFQNENSFVQCINKFKESTSPSVLHLRSLLSKDTLSKIKKFNGKFDINLRDQLVNDFNNKLSDEIFWDREAFSDVEFKPDEYKYLMTLISEYEKYEKSGRKDEFSPAWKVEINRRLLNTALKELKPINQTPPFPNYKQYYWKRMAEIVKSKAEIGKHLHRGKKLLVREPSSNQTENIEQREYDLMALFNDPDDLLDKLSRSKWINVNHPNDSEFYNLLGFNGPMYKIFNNKEREVLRDWIESLNEPSQDFNEPQIPVHEDEDDIRQDFKEPEITSPEHGGKLPTHSSRLLETVNNQKSERPNSIFRSPTFSKRRQQIGMGMVH